MPYTDKSVALPDDNASTRLFVVPGNNYDAETSIPLTGRAFVDISGSN